MRCSQVIRVMSSSSDEEKKRKLTFLLFLPSLDNQLSKPNPFHKMDTIQNQQKAKMLQGFAKISIGREEMTKMLSVIIEYYN
ncbi:hypothetical protein RO3G_06243 [Rhizopus delemar RA 99-880]|uniref:Uncharacterized protein n=1 Tax=Rhizopus delemar (strain RA 99-880 / ATCC MYA-4621 / FGSC 9543 / NRRL 43880) TaxID=246409 RepID=I1BZA8_RHIO9|nr:hypothetical protein RO3G_06243 [Rhizopus delemar RA 99-880]|eukprot:EIE81538.1 hypothetical protein RO3G_06243 [Rhizopus delemar RA 99-880]